MLLMKAVGWCCFTKVRICWGITWSGRAPFPVAVEFHFGAVGVVNFVFAAEESHFFDGVGESEVGEVGLQELLGRGGQLVDRDGAFVVVGFGNGQGTYSEQGCEKQFFHGFKNFRVSKSELGF